MRDIGNRIIDLALIKRTPRPVGKARALVELDSYPEVDQVRIADLFALAQRHSRNLGIEHWMRGFAGQVEENFNILSARVENLQHILIIAEQFEHRGHIEPFCLRVDGRRFIGIGQLDEAKVGIICVFPHEFGIDGDERRLGQTFAQFREAFAVGDKRVNLHLPKP